MTITYHPELIQGSDEWHAARCGLLTASEMKLIVTPPPELAIYVCHAFRLVKVTGPAVAS